MGSSHSKIKDGSKGFLDAILRHAVTFNLSGLRTPKKVRDMASGLVTEWKEARTMALEEAKQHLRQAVMRTVKPNASEANIP